MTYNIQIHKETIEDAGDVVKIWDNYQYELCKLYKHTPEGSEDFKIYRMKLESALRVMTRLQLALARFSRNPAKHNDRVERAMDEIEKLLTVEDIFEQQDRFLDDVGFGTRVVTQRRRGGN